MFFSVFTTVVDTILLCYCDEQRMNTTPLLSSDYNSIDDKNSGSGDGYEKNPIVGQKKEFYRSDRAETAEFILNELSVDRE